MHENNQVYKVSYTKTRIRTCLIKVQIVKQEKQEQKHDMCKTRIQKDFIAIMK
jgi:hypothetical protein